MVESAFGILANRFRILHRPVSLALNNIDKVIQTCCILHNFLRVHCPESDDLDREDDITHDLQLAAWRRDHPPLESVEARGEEDAGSGPRGYNRDKLLNYFTSAAGEVPWQYRMI